MGQGVLMPSFRRAETGGTLHCEGVPLDVLAREVGTPVYVYSANAVRAQYERLSAVLRDVPHRIHYACKANGSLGILRLLHSLGCGIDVVSGGELHRARLAGFAPGDIVFGGVGKSAREIGEALDAGVSLLSAESAAEIDLIEALAAERGVTARVGLRINPEIDVDTFHDYIKTGEKGDKFGIPWEQCEAVAMRAHDLPHIQLAALGMHIGSQLEHVVPYERGLERLEALVDRLRSQGVTTLEHVDIGGGLFVPYDDEPPVDLDAYAAIVVPAVQRLGLKLIVEPGRFMVAEAGALVTTVLYRKESGGRQIIISDAGMNDLLRPSHYDAYHRIEPVVPSGRRGRFDVVGPICESGDFLAIAREMDDVHAGDLLCVFTAGAYGYAMASNYNARPRPAEVLVDEQRWSVITRRESYADLVRTEVHTPEWRVSQ
jgi:diaminopimelate decarboxylase